MVVLAKAKSCGGVVYAAARAERSVFNVAILAAVHEVSTVIKVVASVLGVVSASDITILTFLESATAMLTIISSIVPAVVSNDSQAGEAALTSTGVVASSKILNV